jgi:signal transduction histidine kinase
VATASASIDRERIEIQKLIATAKLGVLASLFLFAVSIAYSITFLTRQILQPINRAVRYAQRIAEGDFTPIRPMRKYRDEFSNLSMAINRMIHEIHVRQEQLLQSRKMAALGTVTAGIAHEINNPLNNISLIAETLIDDFDSYSKEEKQKMLGDIFAQVERVSGTVKNLLDFTRVEKPTLSSVMIGAVIQSTLALLKNEIALNDIHLELNCDDNLPPIQGNMRNLQQVFFNLILNSIQAMPHGGKIRVTSSVDSGLWVRIDVADTGCGIPAENLDKIFDPFFTTKEVGKGTGLGLAVSYGIIESHKGKITVKSQIAAGTTFSVYLPFLTSSI